MATPPTKLPAFLAAWARMVQTVNVTLPWYSARLAAAVRKIRSY